MAIEINIAKDDKRNSFYHPYPNAYFKITYQIRNEEVYVYINVYPTKESRENNGNSFAKLQEKFHIEDLDIQEFTEKGIKSAIYIKLSEMPNYQGIAV